LRSIRGPGFKKAFTQALTEVARRKPHTAIGTGLANIGRRLLPSLDSPNVCDLLLVASFDSGTSHVTHNSTKAASASTCLRTFASWLCPLSQLIAHVGSRATVTQRKTQRPVQLDTKEQTEV